MIVLPLKVQVIKTEPLKKLQKRQPGWLQTRQFLNGNDHHRILSPHGDLLGSFGPGAPDHFA